MLFCRVKIAIVKTVMGTESKFVARAAKYMQYRGNCFELLGFDMMIDEQLRAFVIEVNPDPDMSATEHFPLAMKVKTDMLTDLFKLIGMDPTQMGKEGHEDKRTLAHAILSSSLGQTRSFLPSMLRKYQKPSTVQEACDPSQVLRRCAILSADEALLLAEGELEYHNRGAFDRIFPVPPSSVGGGNTIRLLSLFDDLKRSDALSECWETEMEVCGLRYKYEFDLSTVPVPKNPGALT